MIYRDLKPENLLLDAPTPDAHVSCKHMERVIQNHKQRMASLTSKIAIEERKALQLERKLQQQ
ncbi:hypothetical protein GGF32_001436 [Allomyces javanicus]|nr:hypothetical protein GGF32_001436 [Allomyces javanicus]